MIDVFHCDTALNTSLVMRRLIVFCCLWFVLALLTHRDEGGAKKQPQLEPQAVRNVKLPALKQKELAERPDLVEQVKQALKGKDTTVTIFSLQGFGGVGKTKFAVMVVHDEAIKQTFGSERFWVSLNDKDDCLLGGLSSLASQIANINGIDLNISTNKTPEQQSDAYQTFIAKHLPKSSPFLVVLDNVWRAEHVEVFQNCCCPDEESLGKLLLTSRVKTDALELDDVVEVSVAGSLAPEMSLKLLATVSGLPTHGDQNASAIADMCDHHVLTLAMWAALAKKKKKKSSPAKTWQLIRERLDAQRESGQFAGALPGRLRPPAGYQHKGWDEACQTSLNFLSEELKDASITEKYVMLSLCPDGEWLITDVLAELWGGSDDADDLADEFEQMHLLERSDDGAVKLHDLQLDYARILCKGGEGEGAGKLASSHARAAIACFRLLGGAVDGDMEEVGLGNNSRAYADDGVSGMCARQDQSCSIPLQLAKKWTSTGATRMAGAFWTTRWCLTGKTWSRQCCPAGSSCSYFGEVFCRGRGLSTTALFYHRGGSDRDMFFSMCDDSATELPGFWVSTTTSSTAP